MGGDELNCKKTTFYHLHGHTILSTYQELIKNKQTYHHYTCTELHTCFETFVMIITFSSLFIILTKLLTSSYNIKQLVSHHHHKYQDISLVYLNKFLPKIIQLKKRTPRPQKKKKKKKKKKKS